jgi:signal transduction histidine kinase
MELARLHLPLLESGLRPEAVLSAPLLTRRGIIGFLEIYAAMPYVYSLDETYLVSVLATEMATAVENAQLYASLREKEASLTILAHKLIHSQEEERRRIARDLHDGLAQTIVSAFQHLQVHAYTLPEGTDRTALERGMALLKECVDESRTVIFDLRPATLDDFGLVEAIRQFLTQLESDLGWQILFVARGLPDSLPPALEIAIFRMVKEAITNARKHARTTRLAVRLRRGAQGLVITVRDWGRGFNPGESVSATTGQFGLVGIKERVSLLHGTFQIRSRPGAGTLIRIILPLE